MNIIDKWNEIITWQKANMKEPIAGLSQPTTDKEITQIEALLEEKVPGEFRELYLLANGQENNGDGVLFGHGFMGTQEITRELESSRSFIKPSAPVVENPVKSNELIEQIVAFYMKHTAKRNLFGFRKSWHRIEFTCSPNAFTDPFLYHKEDTTEDEREIVEVKNYEPVYALVGELYELEKRSYNWDELRFIIFADGRYDVRRQYYNFDSQIPLTSTPENAIRKKYFHYKWLPVFSDYGGNFIGIDLDPDVKGVKAQVINFGRDEVDMFVIARSLEQFFDLILKEIRTNDGIAFKTSKHLHDAVKEILLRQN